MLRCVRRSAPCCAASLPTDRAEPGSRRRDDRFAARRFRHYAQRAVLARESELLGIIEIVAVIIGVAALVYLVYALLKADRF
ncbi:hypothetical protein BV502_14775 [Leucobacter sp. OAMLP11]|nr:hypothetical protein BV502_14775 [Leucobacter sp. OAMLP11]